MADIDAVSSYILNYMNALEAMENAKTKLKKMITNLTLPETERAAAAAAFLDMSEEMGRMQATHAVFIATFPPGVKGPSDAVVQKSLDLAKQLGEVIAEAKEAVAIIAAVTRVVDAWTRLAEDRPAAVLAAAPVQAVSAQPAAAAVGAPGLTNSNWLAGHSGRGKSNVRRPVMATNEKHFCFCLTEGDISDEDKKLICGHKAALLRDAKWDVGSVITVRFLEGTQELQNRVQSVAEEWTRLANLTLDFRNSGPTDIRIAFLQGNGSWSYLGKMCRRISEPKPTMNYGWLTPTSSDDELRRVVLHEFGHALGLIHEHQNPKNGGIDWNRAAVEKDLSGPPNNWDPATIEENMFKKYDPANIIATDVDPLSIMMYPIPLAWTNDGTSAGLNSELSVKDRAFIAENYQK